MKMTLRWFGKNHDSVPLRYIKQIPGVNGVITTLYDKKAGEIWQRNEIRNMIDEVAKEGLKVYGIESVNIHDTIKTGDEKREKYIENYIKTLENLAKEGIRLVCYNFMPVFDWTRSELKRKREDGSFVLAYSKAKIDSIHPEKMFKSIKNDSKGHILPGWEPDRMKKIKELFQMYEDVDEKMLIDNLKYFLERIVPVCDKYDINMAIHPDDPGWNVFGLSRIVKNKEDILKIMNLVDNPHNGVTFCTGSFGTNKNNNLPEIIKALEGRIHFAHVRNLKFNSNDDFEEAAHLSSDGDIDMYSVIKALHQIGFNGPIRPDHGRMIWDEDAMPGYGLYDRALGGAYLNGLLEAIKKGG